MRCSELASVIMFLYWIVPLIYISVGNNIISRGVFGIKCGLRFEQDWVFAWGKEVCFLYRYMTSLHCKYIRRRTPIAYSASVSFNISVKTAILFYYFYKKQKLDPSGPNKSIE
jgi:hypothetical protein